jgi:hypothetical protein
MGAQGMRAKPGGGLPEEGLDGCVHRIWLGEPEQLRSSCHANTALQRAAA